jgi:hypothetical protein
MFKLCNGCDKAFPHDLVECPVCGRTLAYPVAAPSVIPEDVETDLSGLEDDFPDPDLEPVVHLEWPDDESKPQDNGDSIYPG